MGLNFRGKEEEKVPTLLVSQCGSQESVHRGREQNLLVVDFSKNVGWAWMPVFPAVPVQISSLPVPSALSLTEEEEETIYVRRRLL